MLHSFNFILWSVTYTSFWLCICHSWSRQMKLYLCHVWSVSIKHDFVRICLNVFSYRIVWKKNLGFDSFFFFALWQRHLDVSRNTNKKSTQIHFSFKRTLLCSWWINVIKLITNLLCCVDQRHLALEEREQFAFIVNCAELGNLLQSRACSSFHLPAMGCSGC